MAVTDYWDRFVDLFTEPVASKATVEIQDAPWDTGAITRALQQQFVRRVDGQRIDHKMTASILFLPLFQTDFMANYLASVAKDEVEDPRRWPGDRSPDVVAFEKRLARYKAVVQKCLDDGRGDEPDCVYESVVVPFLLGYFKRPDGTEVKKLPDIVFVYRWMNGLTIDAQVRAELGPWSLFGLFAEAAEEKLPQAAGILYDAAKESIQNAHDFVKESIDWQRKMMPFVLIAASIGGLVYLSSRYGGRRR